ncbi:hypothetical protein THOM_1193 [Trachipleistophora hominis]|uniref:Uncharacterized protein n=1 Tax=Trachipleistophora hominis TaxID=72359 RepID=L7JXS1_TRAHO|nr:hypothetical protein THOM_1193 [Trachipleistophora hominis]
MFFLSILIFYTRFAQQVLMFKCDGSLPPITKNDETQLTLYNDLATIASQNLSANFATIKFYEDYLHKILEIIYTLLKEPRSLEQFRNEDSNFCALIHFMRTNYSLMSTYPRCLTLEKSAYYNELTQRYIKWDHPLFVACLENALVFLAPFANYIADYTKSKIKIPELNEDTIAFSFIHEHKSYIVLSKLYNSWVTYMLRIRRNIFTIRYVLDGMMRAMNKYGSSCKIDSDELGKIIKYLDKNYVNFYNENEENVLNLSLSKDEEENDIDD